MKIDLSRRVANEAKTLARQEAHLRVMRTIEANPTYSQRDIARSLGISLGAVNYCLNALIKVGFVKVRNFRNSDNKMRYAYILTPKGAAEKAAQMGAFLQRMMREYEALKAEIEALRLEASVNPDQPTVGAIDPVKVAGDHRLVSPSRKRRMGNREC